jgi:hypothetical protein
MTIRIYRRYCGIFSLLQSAQTGCGALAASYLKRIVVPSGG